MPARFRLPLLLLLAAVSALPARALLGETLGELKSRFGPPEMQMEKRKENAYWLFEGDDGQLMYSVTFNAEGKSMAEGLKPLKLARFNKARVMEFIDSEIVLVRNSPTLLRPKPGESYHFAGKTLTVAPTEYIVVDDKNGILVVWNSSGVPAVLVISPEMLNRAGG